MDHMRKFPRTEVHELPSRKGLENSMNNEYKKGHTRVQHCKTSERQVF